MKRTYISGFMLMLMLLMGTSVMAKNKVQKTYLFGFAASFKDSTVYFTDIHELDSAWVTEKHNFLVGRNEYSYQLRNYLSTIGEKNRTCTVSFSKKKKKLEKKRTKMIEKYTRKAKGTYEVKYLPFADFHFKSVAPETGK